MKDNFSLNSEQYQKFRPSYPSKLYDFLLSITIGRENALDCATGNGQVAAVLSGHFKIVYATDISQNQIANAIRHPNIIYKIESAENTSFPDNFFDLITVAQAIHWFKFDEFYMEVKRMIRPGGILAIIGYGLIRTNDETDLVIDKLYNSILGPHWDKERKYIDENYQTIPFPFAEMKTPDLNNNLIWNFDQLIGFLETWSAVQHYIKANHSNPLDLIYDELKRSWGSPITKEISFPILLRVATIK